MREERIVQHAWFSVNGQLTGYTMAFQVLNVARGQFQDLYLWHLPVRRFRRDQLPDHGEGHVHAEENTLYINLLIMSTPLLVL